MKRIGVGWPSFSQYVPFIRPLRVFIAGVEVRQGYVEAFSQRSICDYSLSDFPIYTLLFPLPGHFRILSVFQMFQIWMYEVMRDQYFTTLLQFLFYLHPLYFYL